MPGGYMSGAVDKMFVLPDPVLSWALLKKCPMGSFDTRDMVILPQARNQIGYS